MAKKKRKKRTIQDMIDDIRDLHDKEEDLFMELEDKIQENDIEDNKE